MFISLIFTQVVSGSLMHDLWGFVKHGHTHAIKKIVNEKTKCYDENISNTIESMLDSAKSILMSSNVRVDRFVSGCKLRNILRYQKKWMVSRELIQAFQQRLSECLELAEYSTKKEKLM